MLLNCCKGPQETKALKPIPYSAGTYTEGLGVVAARSKLVLRENRPVARGTSVLCRDSLYRRSDKLLDR